MAEAKSKVETVPDSAILLRRVVKKPDCSQPLQGSDGRRRATSFAIQAKRGESGASVSWSRFTTPVQCIVIGTKTSKLAADDLEIALVQAADIRAFKWDVVHCPTELDCGHCEIREAAEMFSSKRWSKLAKRTLILTEQEINAIQSESDAQKVYENATRGLG